MDKAEVRRGYAGVGGTGVLQSTNNLLVANTEECAFCWVVMLCSFKNKQTKKTRARISRNQEYGYCEAQKRSLHTEQCRFSIFKGYAWQSQALHRKTAFYPQLWHAAQHRVMKLVGSLISDASCPHVEVYLIKTPITHHGWAVSCPHLNSAVKSSESGSYSQ